MVSLLPPKKLKGQWGQCVLGINTHPILVQLGKIAEADPSNTRYPYFCFVKQEHLGQRSEDVTPELAQLSDEIWAMLCMSIQVIDDTHALNKPDEKDRKLLLRYSEILQTPLLRRRG
jgi:hypothetical protein